MAIPPNNPMISLISHIRHTSVGWYPDHLNISVVTCAKAHYSCVKALTKSYAEMMGYLVE
jgi:hypothetical protein